MTDKPRIIECAVDKIELTLDGVKDYIWPISCLDRIEFSKSLMESLCFILSDTKNYKEAELLPYKIFSFHFLVGVITLFQGDMLRENSIKQNLQVHIPSDWPNWPATMIGKAPKPLPILQQLISGPAKTPVLKKVSKLIIKTIKAKNKKSAPVFSIDGLKIKPITATVIKHSIIATQRTSLLLSHAKVVEKEVVYCSSSKWFQKISSSDWQKSLAQASYALENQILLAIQDLYKKFGLTLTEAGEYYIKNTLQSGAASCRHHYNSLLKNPEKLPIHIWTGTTGNIWDTMLRLAVMQKGGQTSAHDHGSGASHIDYIWQGFHELWGCDNFYTFNQNTAREMTILAQKWVRFDDKIPAITAIENTIKPSIRHFNKFDTPYFKPKKIFYMATLFDNDRGRAGPGNCNTYIIDWQIRLLRFLQLQGYEVIYKIHPETKIMPPPFFETNLGAKVTKEPFTNIIHEADLVIFDCIYTTAFTDCLATNIPMILFDFFKFPFTDVAQSLIHNRVEIIESNYIDNRACPDWDKFENALSAAPTKCNNHEFYEHYFC